MNIFDISEITFYFPQSNTGRNILRCVDELYLVVQNWNDNKAEWEGGLKGRWGDKA